MFWGLIMEPGRCYSQSVKTSFHISMAALDLTNCTDEPSQVMCLFEDRNYLLCTLNKKNMLQCPLDLNFEAGTKVSFASNGKSHIHLSGYLIGEDDDLSDELEEQSEDEVEEKPQKKKKKKEADGAPPKKKQKAEKTFTVMNMFDEAEEEESSDSDFDVTKMLNDDVEEEEQAIEEEDESGEDEEMGEEEAEEDDSEDDSLSDEDNEKTPTVINAVKPKQNGIEKKPAKKMEVGKKQQMIEKTAQKNEQQKKTPKKQVLKGGIQIEDIKDGNGEIAKQGKFLHVYYEGRLKSNNKVFDSANKGPGFSFRLGKSEVIKGWDVGLVGMKVGGKRRLTIPAPMAYGQKGSPPVIPPNSTLVFEIELKKVS